MKKYLLLLLALALTAGTPKYGNIYDQTTADVLPAVSLAGAYYPAPDIGIAANVGWRVLGADELPADGYRVTSWIVGDVDGINGKRVIGGVTNIADEAAAQSNAVVAMQAAMQAAKSPELKATENQFLQFCNVIAGNTNNVKLDFPFLQATMNSMATNPATANQAVVMSLNLLSINAAGQKYGSLQWWDSCQWHPEIVTNAP